MAGIGNLTMTLYIDSEKYQKGLSDILDILKPYELSDTDIERFTKVLLDMSDSEEKKQTFKNKESYKRLENE